MQFGLRLEKAFWWGSRAPLKDQVLACRIAKGVISSGRGPDNPCSTYWTIFWFPLHGHQPWPSTPSRSEAFPVWAEKRTQFLFRVTINLPFGKLNIFRIDKTSSAFVCLVWKIPIRLFSFSFQPWTEHENIPLQKYSLAYSQRLFDLSFLWGRSKSNHSPSI